MLQNAYLLAKFGFDTAENESTFAHLLDEVLTGAVLAVATALTAEAAGGGQSGAGVLGPAGVLRTASFVVLAVGIAAVAAIYIAGVTVIAASANAYSPSPSSASTSASVVAVRTPTLSASIVFPPSPLSL